MLNAYFEMVASQFPLHKLRNIVRNHHQEWNCEKSEDSDNMLICGRLNICFSSLHSYVLNYRTNNTLCRVWSDVMQ